MISSLLSVAYLLPIVARAFFLPPPGAQANEKIAIAEAPIACVIALCITAAACVALFFFAGDIEALLAQIDFAPQPIEVPGAPNGS